jgi:hypothetical protein
VLSVVYLWSETDPAVIEIRLISARKATQASAGDTRKDYEQRGWQ